MKEWVTAKARINGLDRSTNRILEQISNKTLKKKKKIQARGDIGEKFLVLIEKKN